VITNGEEKIAAWRPNTGQRIDALYAWIATEPGGGEGIRSIAQGDMHLPIDIGALGAQLRSIRDDLAALKADVRVLAATVDRHGPCDRHGRARCRTSAGIV
jgi:hypothetical protein